VGEKGARGGKVEVEKGRENEGREDGVSKGKVT